MKNTLRYAVVFSAFSAFAEPMADFTIPYESVKVEYSLIDDLAEIKRLEKERKKAQKKQAALEKKTEQKRDQSPYTIGEPIHKEIGLSGLEKKPVKKFLDYYLSAEGRTKLAKVLFESEEYRIYIREQLEKRKMPMFLQYLPIVESEYKTTALSVSGAVGLWQFMENSMSPFLKKSEYYDERYDPWLETDAALSKLMDNYNMFGSWELALAAYNMGAGAINRIRKESKADFWMLAELELLSNQAALYVPKLIAITEAVENADWYGAIEIGVAATVVEGKTSERFGRIKITGRITLEAIAEKSGMELDVLKKLNPALIKGCTPPDESWTLRVPAGKAKEVADSLRK